MSDNGRVFSHVSNRILKGGVDTDGYCYFAAYEDGVRKNILIHRAVATAFIPNPDNLPVVNHKDENPANNCVDNLEWCTVSYNNSYNDRGRRSSKTNKPVYQYSLNGELEAKYFSAHEVSRMLGISHGSLCACCAGKLFTFRNKVFSYEPLSAQDVKVRLCIKQNNVRKPRRSTGECHNKKVEQCDIYGNVINTYESASDAANKNEVKYSTMTKWCRKGCVASNGYVWRYKDLSSIG